MASTSWSRMWLKFQPSQAEVFEKLANGRHFLEALHSTSACLLLFYIRHMDTSNFKGGWEMEHLFMTCDQPKLKVLVQERKDEWRASVKRHGSFLPCPGHNA